MFHIYHFIIRMNILSSIFNILQLLNQSIFLHHNSIYHLLVQLHFHKNHKLKNPINRICIHQYMVHIYLLILSYCNIHLNIYDKLIYHHLQNTEYIHLRIFNTFFSLNNNFPNKFCTHLNFHNQHNALTYHILKLFFFNLHNIQAQLIYNLN